MKTLTCYLLLVASVCMGQGMFWPRNNDTSLSLRLRNDDRFSPKIEFERDDILLGMTTIHTNYDVQKHPGLIEQLRQVEGIERIHSDQHYQFLIIYGKMFDATRVEVKCAMVIADYFKNGITVSRTGKKP